jgi:peptidoglycan/xylan/chitin deacetylase (PgdA/CDA1 family)
MEALVRYSSPASPADGTHQASDGRNVAVTFDDGFVSVLENAIPEMESRAIPCVLFVPTGSIGRNAMWLKNSKSGSGSKLVISRKLLTELKNKSAFIIGSHSVTHADLTSLSEDEAWRELVDSKSVLEEILGRKIDLFSFPHGMYNTHLITMARRAGYRKVFSISPSFASESEYVMGRVRADPSDWNLEFALKIRGAYRWLSWVGSGV